MSCDRGLELSVVVPVYNESAHLRPFLHSLARQQGVGMEVIISDGGSSDGSAEAAGRCREDLPFPLRVVEGPRGRAGQLNRGARAAGAPTLLFLHIDCGFPDPRALRQGLDALAAARRAAAGVAGRFILEFDFPGEIPLPYRFYGAKAALDRPGCTHGDQGFLIDAGYFREVGPFDPALPIMEDTVLAERIRERGRWILLPARIRTSPRRFLSEGLRPRQTLNAIITDLAALGRFELIEELRGCYRSQHAAQRLDLHPFLCRIRSWIAALPPAERRRFWHDTGSHVRANASQIPFFLDLVRGGAAPGKAGSLLAWHDRYLERPLNHPAVNWTAAALVWVWFKALLWKTRKGREII